METEPPLLIVCEYYLNIDNYGQHAAPVDTSAAGQEKGPQHVVNRPIKRVGRTPPRKMHLAVV